MGYRRNLQEKRKLEKLFAETRNKYARGVWYDKDRDMLFRYSVSDHSKWPKFYRKQTNKRVRKCPYLVDGCHYKKLLDYWWQLT